MLSRGRARGLHRHPQGHLGAADSRLGARDRATRHVWVGPGGRPSWLRERSTTLDDLRSAGRAALAQRPDSAPLVTPGSVDETAAILFTSGSTGPPKGAVYTHAIFLAQVKAFRALYAIEPGEIDLCTFPLFALFAPALGMTAIVPDMDPTRPARVDPAKIFEAIEDFGVTNLFGSPALLRRLVEGAETSGTRLPTLKRIISAGAPVSAAVLERLARLLDPPGSDPYALRRDRIAAGRLDRQRRDPGRNPPVHRQGHGRLRRPAGAGDRRQVIGIDDDPIATWSDDLLVARRRDRRDRRGGAGRDPKYFNRPEATALAKIADPAGRQFYHRMGDVGYRDDRGRLWFCGRKSHRVIAGGETYFTIPCEAIFNTHPEVARSALVGVSP